MLDISTGNLSVFTVSVDIFSPTPFQITNYRNKFEVTPMEDFLKRVRNVKSNILELFPSMKSFKPVFSQCDADDDLYREFVVSVCKSKLPSSTSRFV